MHAQLRRRRNRTRTRRSASRFEQESRNPLQASANAISRPHVSPSYVSRVIATPFLSQSDPFARRFRERTGHNRISRRRSHSRRASMPRRSRSRLFAAFGFGKVKRVTVTMVLLRVSSASDPKPWQRETKKSNSYEIKNYFNF